MSTYYDENCININLIQPHFKSTLHITPHTCFNLPMKKPNWWWRMWQWIFFGFVWRNYDN